MTASMLCPHMAFSLGMCFPSVSSSSCKDTSPVGLGHTLMASFNFSYILKGPIELQSHLGFQHMRLGRTQFRPQHMPTHRFRSLVYVRLVGKKKGYSVNRGEKKYLSLGEKMKIDPYFIYPKKKKINSRRIKVLNTKKKPKHNFKILIVGHKKKFPKVFSTFSLQRRRLLQTQKTQYKRKIDKLDY